MKRTPGPWKLRGTQVRADSGKGAHVATYQISVADGLLIAAAPELLSMLLDACCMIDEAIAGDMRERLERLGLVKLGVDPNTHLPSGRVEPADDNPDLWFVPGGSP